MVATELKHNLSKFLGINIREGAGQIKDNELVECQNFDIGLTGNLTKRTGFETLHSGGTLGLNAVILLGYFHTGSFSQLLARVGTSVYYSTDGGVTWVICPGGPHGNVEWGCQYVDKFYIVRRDAVMLEWNGTTMTAITGSPMGSFVIPYKDRLFVLNTYASGLLASRLYFSKIADFSATGWASTNFLDVSQGDGDVNVVCSQLQDVFIIFKSRSTWMLYVSGDPLTWTLRNSSPEIGCVSRYTPRVIESTLYFLGLRGIYRTDGSSFDEISANIQFTFSNQVASVADLNKSCAGWWQDRYIIFLALINQNSLWNSLNFQPWNNLQLRTWDGLAGSYYQGFVYYIRTGSWGSWKTASSVELFNFVEIDQVATHRGLVAGSRIANGKVYRYGSVLYQDDGSNYECRFLTKDFDFGSYGDMKRGKLLVVEYDAIGDNLFYNILDGVQATAQMPANVQGRKAYKLRASYYFRLWQLLFSASHNGPITIYSMTLFLHAKSRVIKVST